MQLYRPNFESGVLILWSQLHWKVEMKKEKENFVKQLFRLKMRCLLKCQYSYLDLCPHRTRNLFKTLLLERKKWRSIINVIKTNMSKWYKSVVNCQCKDLENEFVNPFYEEKHRSQLLVHDFFFFSKWVYFHETNIKSIAINKVMILRSQGIISKTTLLSRLVFW